MKKHLNEIGIMRAILILSIVLGHTFAIYSGSSLSWIRPESIGDVAAYHWLNWIFIAFSLQSFVFMSGYLMAYSESFTQIEPKAFIKKKFFRLILPLLLFGIIYSLWIDEKSFKELIDWGGDNLYFVRSWTFMVFTYFVLMFCRNCNHCEELQMANFANYNFVYRFIICT